MNFSCFNKPYSSIYEDISANSIRIYTMNDLTLIRTRYENGSYLSYPAMKRVMHGTLANKTKVTIPDNLLALRRKSGGTLSNIISKIVIVLQYLWHRFKLLNKSYRMRFKNRIKVILQAYEEKTKQIYQLANKSINHQGKIAHLKNVIQEVENELLENNRKLQDAEKAHNKKIKQHQLIVGNATELTRLYKLTPFSREYWTCKQKISTLFKEIIELDKEFLWDNNPQNITLHDLDHSLELYSLDAECPVGLVKTIHTMKTQLSALQEENARITARINTLKEELPKEEEDNKAVLEELQTITQIPEYVPIIDEEEGALLGESPVRSTEENPKPERSTTYLQMIKDVRHHTACRDLACLWVLLLNNDKDLDQRIKSWKCDEQGNFSLEFHQPLKLWIDTSDRKGGCVFLLANNHNCTIKGRLKDNLMQFESGLDSQCIHKIAMVNKVVNPKMDDIFYENPHSVKMSATCMGVKGENIDTFTNMKQTWKKKILLIPEDFPGGHTAFLKDKFNKAK